MSDLMVLKHRFLRGRLTARTPEIKEKYEASFSNAIKTLDVRPSGSQRWRVTYAVANLTDITNGTDSLTVKIMLINEAGDAITLDQSVGNGAVSNSQRRVELNPNQGFIINSSKYLRLHVQVGGSSTAAIGHMVCFTEVV